MSTLPPLAHAARSAHARYPPQVEIMHCSNHITGISAANVRKVSNVTRDTLKQTLEIRLRLHSLSFSQVTDSIMNSCTYSGPYSDNFHREGTLHTSMTRNPTRTPTRGLHFARHGTVTSRLSNRRLRGSLRTNDVNDIHTPGRTASSATQGARVVCTKLYVLDFCCYGFWIFVVMVSGFMLLWFLDFCCYVFWIFVVLISGFLWY